MGWWGKICKSFMAYSGTQVRPLHDSSYITPTVERIINYLVSIQRGHLLPRIAGAAELQGPQPFF